MSVYVRPYAWEIKEVNVGNEVRTNIHCWAMNRESESVLLNINDYFYQCSLALPMFVNNKFVQWTQSKVNDLMDHLRDDYRLKFQDNPLFELRYKYYYHQKVKWPLARVRFTNEAAKTRFTTFFNDLSKTDLQGVYQVFEADITPHRKLVTERRIKYSDWLMCEGKIPHERISTAKHEYNVSYLTVNPAKEDTSSWITHPGYLSVDLECYSHNSRRMPDAYSHDDAVFMVSCVYQKKKDGKRVHYGIVIGDCGDMSHLENCQIIRVKDEIELYQAFAEIVRITDPEIITGWNIFNFDFTYMNTRMDHFNTEWPVMSRLLSDKKCDFFSRAWRSGAYGKVVNAWPVISGRISMDLYPVIKREFPGRLKYKLDTIAKEFLGFDKGKEDVTPQQMFKVYELSRDIREARARDEMVPMESEEYLREKMAEVMSYCIRDSIIPIDIAHKTYIFECLTQMSIVVGVPILDVYSKGQQQRCYSMIYDYANRNGYVLNKIYSKSNKYAGGAVCDPVTGYHRNVACLDFKSLYPSIIIAFNICHTTLIKDIDKFNFTDQEVSFFNFKENVEIEDEDDKEVLFMLAGKKKKSKIVEQEVKEYFVKQKVKKGIIPMIVEDLINQRNAVKDKMANAQKEIDIYFEYLKLWRDIRDGKIERFDYTTCKEAYDKAAEKLQKIIKENEKLARDGKPLVSIDNDMSEVERMRFYVAYCLKDGLDFSDVSNSLASRESEFRVKIDELQILIKTFSEREKAIKVSTNSYYGFLGVHENGVLPLIEGAKVVTYKGRQLINTAADALEKHFPVRRVYGDTDSVMMKIDESIPDNECYGIGKKMAEFINGVKKGATSLITGEVAEEYIPGLFKNERLQMDLEKIMDMILFKKKKYAAWLKDKDGMYIKEKVADGEEENKLLKKGIDIARRDNCAFFRKVYTKALVLCLQQRPFMEVLTSILNDLNDLIEGRVSYHDLSIIVGINDVYKSKSNMMNIFKEYLNDEGIHVSGGDRLEFLITNQVSDTKGGDVKVGHKLRLIEQIESDPGKYTVDYDYYMMKKLCNPLNQLLNVVYKEDIEMSKSIMTFKRTSRSKVSYLDKAVNFYNKIRSENPHEECIKFFNYNYDILKNLRSEIETSIGRKIDFFNGDALPFKQEVQNLMKKWKANIESGNASGNANGPRASTRVSARVSAKASARVSSRQSSRCN